MRILLDTSVIIKLGGVGKALTPSLQEAIYRSEALFVSPIARAEIAIKVSIGKLPLPVTAGIFWESLVSRLQAAELPFCLAHADALSSLPLFHVL